MTRDVVGTGAQHPIEHSAILRMRSVAVLGPAQKEGEVQSLGRQVDLAVAQAQADVDQG